MIERKTFASVDFVTADAIASMVEARVMVLDEEETRTQRKDLQLEAYRKVLADIHRLKSEALAVEMQLLSDELSGPDRKLQDWMDQ